MSCAGNGSVAGEIICKGDLFLEARCIKYTVIGGYMHLVHISLVMGKHAGQRTT
jgi:hypothetical protein